jgi:hypothetical protein
MDDPFIRQYVEDLLRKIRTQVTHIQGGCVSRRTESRPLPA